MKTLLSFISIFALIACGTIPKTIDNQENKEKDFKNPLVGIHWKITGAAFVNESATSYTLFPPKEENKFPDFGHFVQFNEDGSFSGHYSAPCGNDCFTSVNGKYTMTNENQVKIFIIKATNSGFCNDTLLIENKNMGLFEIIPQKDKSYLLKRS